MAVVLVKTSPIIHSQQQKKLYNPLSRGTDRRRISEFSLLSQIIESITDVALQYFFKF